MKQDMAYNKEFYQLPDEDLVDYGNDSEKEVKEPPPTGNPTTAEVENEANACFTMDIELGKELYTLATGRLQDLCRQWAQEYPGFWTIRGGEIFQQLSTDLSRLL